MSERKKYIESNGLKTNYTSIFILPMLDFGSDFFDKHFISAYLIDEEQPKIVCVFENSSSEDLKGTIWELQNHEQFVSIDYGDNNNEVIIVLKIPKEEAINYNLFKIGRYSKFSNDYKEKLLTVHGRKTGNGKCIMMSDALFPDHLAKQFRADKIGISINDLPGGEVMSIPDMEREKFIKVEDLVKEESK